VSDKTNKLNIYLIKPEYRRFEDIIAEGTKSQPIDDIGTFYMEDSHAHPPSWLEDFFGGTLKGKLNLITSNAKSVLLVETKNGGKKHIFAVSFGFGRSLLNEGVIEDRFGLRVVLNAVDPKSLRSIDKTTLGSIPKQSREQMSREGVAANFGIDIEQDLISSVTGRSRDSQLGKTISGRDALSISVKVDVKSITKFLMLCFKYYKSDAYKKEFNWIDQIKDIRNKTAIDKLDESLLERLKARQLEKIWMAVPEVVDWVDIKGFRYIRSSKGNLALDLNVTEFLESLGKREISQDLLKKTQIYAISTKTDEAFNHWNAYKCIYAEIECDGTVCVLNNGKWYEIAKDFVDEVSREFKNTGESAISLPEYAHADENTYNKSLPDTIPDSHCMDRQMITYGGGHSSIEFCDLTTKDKKLIHVKKYGGSTQLNHLFSQGVVSGELFVQDEIFRKKLNEKLPAGFKLQNTNTRPDPREYEIVFAIISKSRNPLEIPFFSKVSFRNARRRLQGYGYTVTKKKIGKRSA